jgi:hypothetical protein
MRASRNSFQLARNEDLRQGLPARAAVDAGRLVELVGKRFEVADQDEHGERDGDGQIRDDERGEAVEQSQIADEQEERDDERDVGDHARGENAVDRGLPAAEADLRHRVRCRHAHQQIEYDDRAGNDHAVAERRQQVLRRRWDEAAAHRIRAAAGLVGDVPLLVEEDGAEVLEGGLVGNPVRRLGDDLPFALERG